MTGIAQNFRLVHPARSGETDLASPLSRIFQVHGIKFDGAEIANVTVNGTYTYTDTSCLQ